MGDSVKEKYKPVQEMHSSTAWLCLFKLLQVREEMITFFVAKFLLSLILA